MYAIIASGSKQYRVSKGDEIDVELLEGEIGSAIELSEVLFVRAESEKESEKKSHVGAPHLSNFVVKATIVADTKGPKVSFMKYRPSQNERKKKGHRQRYSRLRIDEITKV